MKEQLIELSKEKGFSYSYVSPNFEKAFYLWMCELEKWLRDEHQIYISVMCSHIKDLTGETNEYSLCCEWEISDRKDMCGVGLSYEETLEEALLESLKLIK